MQRCLTHGKQCFVPFVDYDHSGLPCTDNSKANHDRRFFAGATGPLFAIWALRLRRYSVKLAILENTPAPWIAVVGGHVYVVAADGPK